MAQLAVDTVFSRLADCAGVEDHKIGLFRRGAFLVTGAEKLIFGELRVILVHLASVGLDVKTHVISFLSGLYSQYGDWKEKSLEQLLLDFPPISHRLE